MTEEDLDSAGVALCFKVPFPFRQWFKLQALSRNITMTEFLILAARHYAQSGNQGFVREPPVTDFRK